LNFGLTSTSHPLALSVPTDFRRETPEKMPILTEKLALLACVESLAHLVSSAFSCLLSPFIFIFSCCSFLETGAQCGSYSPLTQNWKKYFAFRCPAPKPQFVRAWARRRDLFAIKRSLWIYSYHAFRRPSPFLAAGPGGRRYLFSSLLIISFYPKTEMLVSLGG